MSSLFFPITKQHRSQQRSLQNTICHAPPAIKTPFHYYPRSSLVNANYQVTVDPTVHLDYYFVVQVDTSTSIPLSIILSPPQKNQLMFVSRDLHRTKPS